MKVTTRGEYGLRALYELAKRHGTGPVPIKTISAAQGISEAYLEQLFSPLRKAGLVLSTRGTQGGYELSRDPSEISVGDALRVLEGPLTPIECVSEDGDGARGCDRSGCCPTRMVWEKLRDSMVAVLDSITLKDLCEQGRRCEGDDA